MRSASRGSNFCAMMPERLAKTDSVHAGQADEMVGSGPFSFKADERVVGSQVVYERNADYVPRASGTPEWTSGPKIVHFDRVEWHVHSGPVHRGRRDAGRRDGLVGEPDRSTCCRCCKRGVRLVVQTTDTTGLMACMRLNQICSRRSTIRRSAARC